MYIVLFCYIIDEKKVCAWNRNSLRKTALFEWYDSLVFALAVIVLFFVFAVRIIIPVSGVSMQPTLYGGDRVAVQSMLYTPQRGDVVVVDGYINYGDPLVKRIIALGGDTVDINFETGAVTLNGAVLEEPYISAPTTTGYDVEFPVTVPEGCVFVMGDNRPRSLDGRSTEVGFIDERDIWGKGAAAGVPAEQLWENRMKESLSARPISGFRGI